MDDIDWTRVTLDLLESMVVTQADLAEKCMVTQQSISNWKNGIRSPGGYAREKLHQLMVDAKLEKDSYTLEDGAPSRKRSRQMQASLPEDVADFALKLTSYSKKRRQEAISLAEFLLERRN